MKKEFKLLCACLTLVLASCATKPEKMPPDAPTMKEAYDAAMSKQTDYVVHQGQQDNNGNGKNIVKAHKIVIPSMAGALQTEQLRKSQSKLNSNFPLLPNPQLMVYIYPHFQDGMPLHGIWTTFTMYKTNHYALPSEVSTGANLKTY